MKSAFDLYAEEFRYGGVSTSYEGGYKNSNGSGSYSQFESFEDAKKYALSNKNEDTYYIYVDKVLTENYKVSSRERLFTA